MALLKVRDLNLSILNQPILKNIDIEVSEGEIMGVVGESGSGKSLTALSIMQLLPYGAKLTGDIEFAGHNLTAMSEPELCALRGDDIGMVFQEPMTALNPVKTIGDQIAEGIKLHAGCGRTEARERTIDILEQVGLPQNSVSLSRYPHELSGGQRQRVGIAIACAMKPKLLIADEPTTALDVTIQAQILDLLRNLVSDTGMALIIISHDLGVVADMSDSITIMRAGEVMEEGAAVRVLSEQKHAYTRQLAQASTHIPHRTRAPVLSREAELERTEPLLRVEELVCEYPGRRTSLFQRAAPFRAVNNISFDIFERQTMALVGESGCGKSTLARTLLGLQKPTSGAISFEGVNLTQADPEQAAHARRDMQIVFQDPYGSFNPRHRVDRLVSEPLFRRPELSGYEKKERVLGALQSVGLSPDDRKKYIHEFSGGQRQRLAIARALVNRPKMIIADEPVSALDVSIRAQILDLLAELRDELGIAYLFISHDLTVVRALCDEVMVMRAGEIVERDETEAIFSNPQNDYTRELVDAAPDLEKSLANRRKNT